MNQKNNFLEVKDEICGHITRMKAVLQMLVVMLGGEVDKNCHHDDSKLFGLFVFLNESAHKIQKAAEASDIDLSGDFVTAAFNTMAITNTLELMIGNFDLKIPLGDEAMSDLLDAIDYSLTVSKTLLDDIKTLLPAHQRHLGMQQRLCAQMALVMS